MNFSGIHMDAPQRSLSASLTEMFSDEARLLESLEQLISSSGTTQQHCIAQLRSLGLPDDFWMYVFKVVPCSKTYSHKWTLCPCAHAGETARRRDPRVVNYKAVLCPIVKGKKNCPLGDACNYAHNVFEHWLHPSRYKTRLCSFGRNCNRPICFFAHSADELRCVPNAEDGKETIDEREYMLQVMMSQQDGNSLLAARTLGSISSPATPMNGLHSMSAFASSSGPGSGNPFSGLLDLPPHPSPQQQHQAQSQLSQAGSMPPMSPNNMASMHGLNPIRVKSMQHGMQDAMQLMNLQEALACMQQLNIDGLSNMAAAAAAAVNTPGSKSASDPGMQQQQHDHNKILQNLHMNRLSESGQPLAGLGSPNGLGGGLESLLPFMSPSLGPKAPSSTPQHSQQLSSMNSLPVLGGPNQGLSSKNSSNVQLSSSLGASPAGIGLGNGSTSLMMQLHHQHSQPLQHQMSNGLQRQASSGLGLGHVSPPHSPPPVLDRSTSTSDSSCSSDAMMVQRQMSDPASLTGGPVGNPNRLRPMRAASSGPLMGGGAPSSGSGPRSLPLHHQQALKSLAAAAASSSGGAQAMNAGTVNKIVSELQEQGLAGSKDQLVASLSQLLAQLLSPNN